MIVDIKIRGVSLKADIIGITDGWSDLTENTDVDLAGFSLEINNGANNLLNIQGLSSKLQSTDGTGTGKIELKGDSTDEVSFELTANDGTNEVQIFGNAGDNTIEHTAASHIFTGKMNNNTLQEFADDAAAVTGGLLPGDFYYTSDSGSGFLKVVLPAI